MKDIHTVMIGVGKAIEIMGCGQAQLLMTKVATVIGDEIGKELIANGQLSNSSTQEEILDAISVFFKIDFQGISRDDDVVIVKQAQTVTKLSHTVTYAL